MCNHTSLQKTFFVAAKMSFSYSLPFLDGRENKRWGMELKKTSKVGRVVLKWKKYGWGLDSLKNTFETYIQHSIKIHFRIIYAEWTYVGRIIVTHRCEKCVQLSCLTPVLELDSITYKATDFFLNHEAFECLNVKDTFI